MTDLAHSGQEASVPTEQADKPAGHTPGPWVACGSARGGCSCGQVWSKAVDMPVATANGIWGDDLNHPYGEIPAARKLANARLIAAAPDLLVALQWAIGQIDLWAEDFCEPNEAATGRLGEARAAIAKATEA